jgi:hypothetical protein
MESALFVGLCVSQAAPEPDEARLQRVLAEEDSP